MALCLVAGALAARLLWPDFTLIWTHSVQKTEWQEDYAVDTGALRLARARVRGSGAGMEPGPDAQLVDGWYVWTPERALPALVLARSGAVDEYRLCHGGRCQPLNDLIGGAPEPVTVAPCR